MSGAPLLTLDAVDAGYGLATVLRGVSLAVPRGEVLALLGRNGAGKSTTLKAAMGLVPARAGRVMLLGEDATGLPPWRRARLGLGYVPEERRVFAELTVDENLEVGRRPPRAGAPAWTPERLFALFPNLRDMRGRPGGAMSGGEQQMLTLARTLMGNPALLLLDEPSEGLAPVIVDAMARAVAALKAEGLAIVLAEQNLRFARLVADRAAVLEGGEVRFLGSFAELDADEGLRERALGV